MSEGKYYRNIAAEIEDVQEGIKKDVIDIEVSTGKIKEELDALDELSDKVREMQKEAEEQ